MKAIPHVAYFSIVESEYMTSKKLFSILSTSFWIALYYISKLKKQRPDGGAFMHILQSFWNSPKLMSYGEIRHVDGFCYQIELNEHVLSDIHGRSSLLMFEDGEPLKDGKNNVNDIVKKGGGRFFHSENTILFSPYDNADLQTVLSRKYTVMESLSNDPDIIDELILINKDKIRTRNLLHIAFRKLSAYLKSKLTFTGITSPTKTSLELKNITLNLTQWSSGVWKLDNIHSCISIIDNAYKINIIFTGLKTDQMNDSASGSVEFIVNNKTITLTGVQLSIDKDSWITYRSSCSHAFIENSELLLSSLNEFRNYLSTVVGGSTLEYQNWLKNFLSSWEANSFDIPFKITATDAERIYQALTDDSQSTQTLSIKFEKNMGDFWLKTMIYVTQESKAS